MRYINLFLLFLGSIGSLLAQSNPTPFDLSTGDYTLFSHSGTSLPPNMTIGRAGSSTNGVFFTPLTPNAANGSAAGQWQAEGDNGVSYQGSASSERGSFLLGLVTTGRQNISVAWSLVTIIDGSNTNDIDLQYRIGSTGDFTSFSGTLPAAADNQPLVQVRWAYYETGSDTRDRLAIDNISVTSVAPVTWRTFRAELDAHAILLSFSTATERNNAHFEIERSADGRVFATIGRVAGAGTSTRVHEYAFEDKAPRKGVNYYRLRQVDFDGSAHFSQVIAVQNGRTTGMYVVTAPGHSQTRVRLEENSPEEGSWQVMDGSGRVLSTGTLPAESRDFSFETAGWIPGIYVVRLQCGAATFMQRFLH